MDVAGTVAARLYALLFAVEVLAIAGFAKKIDDWRTRAFDDEGMASQRTPLIVGGVLQGFLHNSYTAKKSGAKSTGNASRGGFRSMPGVGSTNLYIEKGTAAKVRVLIGVGN